MTQLAAESKRTAHHGRSMSLPTPGKLHVCCCKGALYSPLHPLRASSRCSSYLKPQLKRKSAPPLCGHPPAALPTCGRRGRGSRPPPSAGLLPLLFLPVAVVDEEVGPEGEGGEVVDAARAVGDVAEDKHVVHAWNGKGVKGTSQL